jgi:Domain of unknown function (DUF4145)
MTQFSWTCRYCSRPQIVRDENFHQGFEFFRVTELDVGDVGLDIIAIACVNEDCKKLTLNVMLRKWENRRIFGDDRLGAPLHQGHLLPESTAKLQPDYIPKALVEDYYEACRIRDLSPKASATLSRRCLQGMIRDFCKIAKGTLGGEIKTLQELAEQGHAPAGVTLESVTADHVRSIGNIGAHMEKDINIIVDVDPGEAEALTNLIEMLFDEWYTARHVRQEKLAQIAAIAAEKKSQIAQAKAQQIQKEN